MNMIDEGKLTEALRDAAASFTVSPGATERILAEAATVTTELRVPRRQRLYAYYGRGRSLALSAAAGLLVVGISVPLLLSESGPSSLAALGPRPGDKTVAGGIAPFLNHAPSFSPNQGVASGLVIGGTGAVMTSSIVVNRSLKVKEVGSVALSVDAKKFPSALDGLAAFATVDGGFVANSQVHTGTKLSGTYSSGSIVIQVPQHNFTKLVGQVKRVGHATSVVTSTTNVTGQYVDLHARISALQLSRQQYLTIMARTTTTGGILAVQSQLDSLQSQIEQLQSQMNLLNSQTTYASLTVSVTVAGSHPNTTPRLASGISKAWHDSVAGFVAGVEWLIRIAGPMLFAVASLAALGLLGRFAWRESQRRRG
jgi:hypothetical protein